MVPDIAEPYLSPYLKAAARHGSAFPALLWASPTTQRTRFDALWRSAPLAGKSVLDVGCGRADLLDFLIERNTRPADYIGLEAVEALIRSATQSLTRHRMPDPSRIIGVDFVREPARMFVAADAVLFSGSLNTLHDALFYKTLRHAYEAATETLAFNFLNSSTLAGREYLFWRETGDVMAFVQSLGGEAHVLDDYLAGDCTIAIHKPTQEHGDFCPGRSKL